MGDETVTGPTDLRRRPGLWPVVAASVEGLSPGAFAFVMATGIVSVGLSAGHLPTVSAVLLLIGLVGYVLLWAAHLWRLVRRRQRFVRDLTGPNGFAFLTVVAASDVLASRLVIGHRTGAAEVLLVIAVAGWLVLGYGIPLTLITAGRSLSLGKVNGTWFIWVVATQSVAVCAASIAPTTTSARALAGLASACWAIGLIQYLLTAALILARLLLEQVGPRELVPPYWVFMGAAAISVLAGAKLLGLPSQDALLPHAFVLGVCLVLWSFCSWLIPLLVALGAWRHLLRRVPLRYETGLWSLVFPLGMYGVATRELGNASGTHWLVTIGSAETWVSAVVWAVVFIAMLTAPLRHRRTPARVKPA